MPKSKGSARKRGAKSQKADQSRNWILWSILSVAVITALCLFPLLRNGFTNWDDEYYVVNNSLLRGPDWIGIFTRPVVSNYHPLTVLSLAANFAISGKDPRSYLILNLLLHLLNVVLVFVFIYSISHRQTLVAFFTALIFGIHPMHVESVAWISERKDLLYTLFYLLALIQYWQFLQSRKPLRLWLCFLLFVFSLLSKPAAIVLPLVLFLMDYWQQRSITRQVVLEKIPFVLVAALFAIITLKLQSVTAMTSLDLYPFWVRLFFASYAVMVYFLWFFVPYPLSAFHPFPEPGHLGLVIYLAPLFLAALLFVIWQFRKNRLVVFGLMFFLVNILLVLQLIPIGMTIVSERYTYVPYIGLAFLFTMLASEYLKEKRLVPAIAGAVVIFSLFGFLTFNRTQVWKDSDSLWSDVINHYPDASLPRGERAQSNYSKATMIDEAAAAQLFERIIEDCTVVINKETDASNSNGKKGGTSMYKMRSVAYNSLKQYEKALADIEAWLAINPEDSEALYQRGTLLVNHYKKYSEALADFNRAIQINPQGKYYLNRSICHYNLGDLAKARTDAEMASQKGVAIPENYRNTLKAGG